MIKKKTSQQTRGKQNFRLLRKNIYKKLQLTSYIIGKTEKMKRQRAMYQMKEQEKNPEKQLNEVEIGNLPEKEFRDRKSVV